MRIRNFPNLRRQKSRLTTTCASFLALSLLAAPTLDAATHYDIYLVGGQSNMDGRGRVNELKDELASWREPQRDIQIFYANPKLQSRMRSEPLTSTWQVLAPGFSVPPNFNGPLPSGTFGPELSFARALADRCHEQHLALIKVTEGGTSLRKDWDPDGGRLYHTFTNSVQEALGLLKSNGDTYTLRGMIWHQGEADVSAGAALYVTNLTNFIQCVRRDLGSPRLPFVIGEIATNHPPAFRQAQASATNLVVGTSFASADGLTTGDGLHFRTAGVLELGRRYANAMIPALLPGPPTNSSSRLNPAAR